MIILLAAPWAAGKSTLADRLPDRLPSCLIFDWDLIIPALSQASGRDVRTDPTTWPGLAAAWAAVLRAATAGGRKAVLLGPATPETFAPGALGSGPVRCGYLDWPDDILVERLRARDRSPGEIAGELAFARRLRRSPHHRIDLAGSDVDQMTDRAAGWIRSPIDGRVN